MSLQSRRDIPEHFSSGLHRLSALRARQVRTEKSAYEIACDRGYTGTEEQWLASLAGRTGKSAYELACDRGYTGTLVEWLASLVGEKGDSGANGKSAYELACEQGLHRQHHRLAAQPHGCKRR